MSARFSAAVDVCKIIIDGLASRSRATTKKPVAHTRWACASADAFVRLQKVISTQADWALLYFCNDYY